MANNNLETTEKESNNISLLWWAVSSMELISAILITLSACRKLQEFQKYRHILKV